MKVKELQRVYSESEVFVGSDAAGYPSVASVEDIPHVQFHAFWSMCYSTCMVSLLKLIEKPFFSLKSTSAILRLLKIKVLQLAWNALDPKMIHSAIPWANRLVMVAPPPFAGVLWGRMGRGFWGGFGFWIFGDAFLGWLAWLKGLLEDNFGF